MISPGPISNNISILRQPGGGFFEQQKTVKTLKFSILTVV
jgi:hypothetical protein